MVDGDRAGPNARDELTSLQGTESARIFVGEGVKFKAIPASERL
jgi:hypothetical protein